MQFEQLSRTLVLLLIFSVISVSVRADEDWPAWRFDAQRTAASDNHLPDAFQPLWQLKFPKRKQAWDDPLNLDLMTYDRVFEPIVVGKHLIVGFNDSDKVVAFNTDSGAEVWTCFADAPVRMPPVADGNRVFFGSDDGFLYCVDSVSGNLLWKFHAAPGAQHAIGNLRLSSAWPLRGGPVVRDGVVYCAASIWPFMGTFIYALDAQSGEVRWVNDSTGADYIKQPHSAPSFAGVGPQGSLVATDKYLIIPGGRSVPAVFNRQDGSLKYFELNAGGKGTGGSFVTASDNRFFVHTRLKGTRAFDLESGLKTEFMPNEPVLAGNLLYTCEVVEDVPMIVCYDEQKEVVWRIPADGTGDLILANGHLVAGGADSVSVVKLPTADSSADVVATIKTPGPAERLLVADRKLFVVTLDGHILSFGNDITATGAGSESQVTDVHGADAKVAGAKVLGTENELAIITLDQSALTDSIVKDIQTEGFALWFGESEHPIALDIARRSLFQQFAVIDDQAVNIDNLRRRLDAAGVYGKTTVHHAKPGDYKAPHYIANALFIAPNLCSKIEDTVIAELYASVRPYGGDMVLLAVETQRQSLAERLEKLGLEQAKVEVVPYGVRVERVGALPGASDWTHQYGDIANTVKSDDKRVKLPLGILWYGGSSNMDVLPRHGHGPPEQVVGGKLFIQGMNCLSARDVYTGRVLWKREFEDLGTYDVYFDDTYEDTPLDPKYNQVHIPGANGRGTNYVVTEDRIYIVERNICQVLDPATGNTIQEIKLPAEQTGDTREWGYIGVYKDVLIGGLGFAKYRDRFGLDFPEEAELKQSKLGFGAKSLDRAASLSLVGFDRHTGEQLWKIDSNFGFWHNGIVAGNDRIFCLDKHPQPIEDAMRRRGLAVPENYRIAAYDFRTGKQLWEVNQGVFGTWLGYSEYHDLLLQAGAKASDRLYAEVSQGMTVYKGNSGEIQWQNKTLDYAGPCILHNDLIITNANSYRESEGAFNIVDGRQKMVPNPLTGIPEPWKLTRTYGCNNIIASENLLTFRSGAAGFYDLLTESGTGNIGGFKSGCTSNLVVANGVLNAPDYTRTCSCSYQNQTSLALVHMPDVELWAVHSLAASAEPGTRIDRLGVNFAAPGDRRDENGLLWIEYPEKAGTGSPVAIELNPEATFFTFHSSQMQDTPYPWITASGAEMVTDVKLRLRVPEKAEEVGEENRTAGSDSATKKNVDEAELTVVDEPTVVDEIVPSQSYLYDVRLLFGAPKGLGPENRVFDVYVQEQLVVENLTVNSTKSSNSSDTAQAFAEQILSDIELSEELHIRLVPKQGAAVLSGIELIRKK